MNLISLIKQSDNTKIIVIMISLILFIVFIYILDKIQHKRKYNKNGTPKISDQEIREKIKQLDENFDFDEFGEFASDVFTRLQYAWSNREMTSLVDDETSELYEDHLSQARKYILNNKINKIENVKIDSIMYLDFTQNDNNDIISVLITAKMKDYIVDEEKRKIKKGKRNIDRTKNYKLTFIREREVNMQTNLQDIKKCPYCGAPTEFAENGICSYCGGEIMATEQKWLLSSIQKYKGYELEEVNGVNKNKRK